MMSRTTPMVARMTRSNTPRQVASLGKPQARRALATSRVVQVHAVAREVISTDKAPAAVGPYSQGVKVGDTVYVSGCIGLVPETMKFAGETVQEQTTQVMNNMGEVLKAAGCDFSHVVKTTILLAEMSDFAEVNKIYATYFDAAPPARATFDGPVDRRLDFLRSARVIGGGTLWTP